MCPPKCQTAGIISCWYSIMPACLRKDFQEVLPALAARAEQPWKIRLLFLDRSKQGWYDMLMPADSRRYRVATLFAPDDPEMLASIRDVEDKRELFAAGLHAWAEFHGRTPLPCPPEGADPSFDTALEARWGEPLYLLIAAFVTAEAGSVDAALPMNRVELVEYAANRERDELTRRIDQGLSAVTRQVWRVLLPRMAAWNTISMGVARDRLVAACAAEAQRLGYAMDGGPGVLVDRLAELYTVNKGRIVPIRPDPVAEAFVLRVIPADAEEMDRAVHFAAAPAFAEVERPVQFLVHAAQTFGWAGGDGASRVRPAIAALQRLVDEVPYEALRAVGSVLPTASNTVLLRPISLRAYERMASRGEQRSYNIIADYAVALAENGRLDEALKHLQEVVMVHRLGASKAPQLRPLLARSLAQFGATLSDLGHHNEAAHVFRECLELYRQLENEEPGVYRADVALAARNLAVSLQNLGCFAGALEASREAVGLYRRLATEAPERFEDYLASSLDTLANIGDSVDQQDADALTVSQNAVEIRRRLARRNPDRYLSELAASLTNLSVHLSRAGHKRAALARNREAVKLYRPLASHAPAIFRKDLATSLTNFATDLNPHKPSHRKFAIEAIREAIGIRIDLAKSAPDAHLPDLAKSLSLYGTYFLLAEEYAQAGPYLAAALVFLARFALASPEAHQSLFQDIVLRYVECRQHLNPELSSQAALADLPNYTYPDEVMELLEEEDNRDDTGRTVNGNGPAN
jgi:Tetratricopeptide repeat